MLASADNLLQRLVATTLLTLAIWLTPGAATAAQSAKMDPAPTACVYAKESEVADLFSSWNLALASLDPAKVTAMYWPDAVLLPPAAVVLPAAPRGVIQAPGATRSAVVWVVEKETVRRREVEIGVQAPRSMEIRRGLAAGETVVLSPPAGLVDGQAVRLDPSPPGVRPAGG